MIRVAAVADIHLGEGMQGAWADDVTGLDSDLLLLAGDLTRHGTRAEARVVAGEFAHAPVPVVAVLGNHDLHGDDVEGVTAELISAGITVLEGTGAVFDVSGARLGVAGTIGFGGGFPPATASGFGEPEMKAFDARNRSLAHGLCTALSSLDCDVAVALTHYAPIPGTLAGEPPQIHAFLGSHLLGRAIDDCDREDVPVALAVHGHAHAGAPDGRTPGGVPVHNVAQPLLDGAFRTFVLGR
ncbi:metallophosphoesterase family protein [Pseudonocardia parietis]|uniref:Icc-related predicted phosphoesterase n=1 Tax=Pseudonocardia parietis TaxID=570936 RepID=A0ABS4W6E7_9PSEU|nr:metallophosphoesterase [Pseudonocardia parietis]MBP2371782.1 Icc-related predicted phosphoesterase [Pseudonocardia parietis]